MLMISVMRAAKANCRRIDEGRVLQPLPQARSCEQPDHLVVGEQPRLAAVWIL
jgi:hypothetical protein